MAYVLEELTKVYGQQRAVDAVSFEVRSGEVLGFLGPNGAGKSTTMKMMTGFVAPTSGRAVLNGLSVEERTLEVRRKIGYLPEHNPLYLDLYVHEFLHLTGQLYGMGGSGFKSRIHEMIELTGLQREQHKVIGSLSKGYRQRVGLAAVMLHDPEVLILDEPTTGLDPNQIIEIRQVIKAAGQKKAVIFSSHILSEVEAIADRVVLINRGKLVLDTPITDLRANFAPEVRLSVEFERSGFRPEGLLQLEGVVSMVQGVHDRVWHLTTQPHVDLRKAIYDQAVAQNNPILSLTRQEFTLEELFRELTTQA
jgi:ABC-2 type transport system ATP-binding protein